MQQHERWLVLSLLLRTVHVRHMSLRVVLLSFLTNGLIFSSGHVRWKAYRDLGKGATRFIFRVRSTVGCVGAPS